MDVHFRRQHLGVEVSEYLRRELIFGRIPPGTHLAEASLAQNLGVSRGPVREALKELEQDGLVATQTNGRTIAVGITEEAVQDLYAVRRELECMAVTLCCERASDDELAALARMAQEIAGLPLEMSNRVDLAMHGELVRLSQNRFLQQAWEISHRLVRSILAESTAVPERAMLDTEREQDHAQMIAALRRRDAALARQTLSKHLTTAARLAVTKMREGRS